MCSRVLMMLIGNNTAILLPHLYQPSQSSCQPTPVAPTAHRTRHATTGGQVPAALSSLRWGLSCTVYRVWSYTLFARSAHHRDPPAIHRHSAPRVTASRVDTGYPISTPRASWSDSTEPNILERNMTELQGRSLRETQSTAGTGSSRAQ